MSCQDIQTGLDQFEPSANRMDVFKVRGMQIINDSYNANPDAMRAALDVLNTYAAGGKRRIAVLGDMLEMGQYAADEHLKIGQYASDKADMLIAVGQQSKKIIDGFTHQEAVYHFDRVDDAMAFFLQVIKEEDVILIKASRGIHLERLVFALKEGK